MEQQNKAGRPSRDAPASCTLKTVHRPNVALGFWSV